MGEYLLNDYLPGFANTVVAELGIALFFGLWSLRQLGFVALVNLVTHPALHLFLWSAFWWHALSVPWLVVLALELAVVLAEAAMLSRWLSLEFRKSILLSAAMNAASYLVGLAITAPRF